MGIPMDDYEGDGGKRMSGALAMAARVISWSEKPLSFMKFDNTKCPGCGFHLTHADKSAPNYPTRGYDAKTKSDL
jgi:hypothetical protein